MSSAHYDQRQAIQICILASISAAFVFLFQMELPWQPYVLKFVPIFILWGAYVVTL
jgi:hypothetical protein